MDKEVEAIKYWEKIHKQYLNKDGSLNYSGYKLCHTCEVEWGDDPKWNDYELFHLRPRLELYWYDHPDESEDNDGEYKRWFAKAHPRIAKELWESYD